MEYDYDLFEEARKQCTDVTLEMIQVQNEANKVKGCPLPEGFNGEYLSALVNEVIQLKTDSIAIQKNLNQWAAAVDEAYRAQCGEEYNDVLLETDSLQRQIDEQVAYLGQLGNSRCTDMDLWNREQEKLYDLNQEKEELNDKKDDLAGILGISTEDDQKWYDVLQDATEDLLVDCKVLAYDYGEMFKSMGTDAFTDNLLRLPLFYELTLEQVDYICSKITSFFS